MEILVVSTQVTNGRTAGRNVAAVKVDRAAFTTAAVTGDCTVLAQFAVIAPGDCDADGAVTAFELQNSIDMFLGLKPVQRCVDLDNSGGVDAGELQKVVVGFPGQ